MKKDNLAMQEKILYSIILLGSLAAVIFLIATDLNPPSSKYEVYFTNYPTHISEGDNVSFSLALQTNDSQSFLTVTVYFDETPQKTIKVVPSGDYKMSFNLQDDFKSGETHKISVKLYDEQQPYNKYGSVLHPYYIFFRVDVV